MYSSMRDSLVEDVSVCGTDKPIVLRPKKRFFLSLKLKNKKVSLYLHLEFHCDKLDVLLF